ncbi:M16 family metallopeptidase [Sediminitomix flava]|uniref:Zinc protease n=1 Tax=Sediminitomix flava TaxID=379075 RepID=A0A315ZGG8_SEDFL|nr:pitrilysin family protein [Sediminitomix flava]PWJ44239.1 zinc protease [Sediminitomix flava]
MSNNLLKAVCLSFLFLTPTFLSAQKLVEKVEADESGWNIPYEKYVLDNGLTVILHQDTSDPLVHVDVTYHVGSAREELNKSGFAHFFEHMMFQGSENVADEEHIKIITEAGGTMNGTTNRDRTNYFETVPSNQLETMLWLEADRMGYFLDAVTQEKFEVQRATVKNEKGQNYDNRPYGQFREKNAEALYPYGHPYSWLTIGILEDLDRVDVEDLKKFFLRWYGPNNATLTVGGDLDVKETLKWVNKYFGKIPAGPAVEDMKLDAPVLDNDRYVSYVDNNIRFPALLYTFPTVPEFHEDEAALECLADIIGQGQDSYFYKKFVLTQEAIQASIFNSSSELAGEFTMFVLPFPGKSLSDFEQKMRDALVEFEKEGVSDEDIQKFKAKNAAGALRTLESVRGKVSRLAHFQTFLGNPNYFPESIKKYESLTKEDVMRVYKKYIKGQYAVIQSVLPKGMEGQAAKPDNYEVDKSGPNPFPTTDYAKVAERKSPKDDFDRSIQPKSGPNPTIEIPTLWRETLANGLKVIGTESKETPSVTLRLFIEGGHLLQAEDKGKVGLASLTADMMREGTENYSAAEFANELEKLGSSISLGSGQTGVYISVNTLKKNLDKTLALLEERMFRPKFTEEDLARLKKQTLEAIMANKKQPVPIANTTYSQLLYGKDHILAISSSGTVESVEALTLADIDAFYKNSYAPQVTQLVVVGDISKEDLLSKVDFLKEWKANDVKVPTLTVENKLDKTTLYIVDKPNAPQSEIRIGYMTNLKYDVDGEFYKATLMNYTLGGAFNSRINLNLREDKGWTYGARSSFDGDKNTGDFTASAGVKGVATDSAVVEFMSEIQKFYESGITEEELTFMKSSIGQKDALKYETPGQKAAFLNRIVRYDLSDDYVKKQSKIVSKIKAKEINEIAKKYLDPSKMYIVVVGDKASLKPKLDKLGYEVVELDVEGNEVPVE